MRNDEIKAIFDQQATSYDERWARTAPIREALHFLLEAVFADLPADARILCVGAGTGEEIAYLARRFPRWSFTAVEPSGAMLEVCRNKAIEGGYAERCQFHEGFLQSLPEQDAFDAATCFLVSQFILEPGPVRSFSVPSLAGFARAHAWPAPTWHRIPPQPNTRPCSKPG